ncbi:hypothetical protein RhiirA5_387843 [Rhizophagus irregularis]|nr:hypothetical protein RhiirA5_387843 [Rhizophagus irregularis]
MQAKIDQTFEKLLNFQMDINGNISYNKNLDVEIIEKEILSKCEFGCLIPSPNVVILTLTGSPNDDNEIFHATQMYKEEFLLNDDEYLDICADEAIFRRLIKSRTQWEKIRLILGGGISLKICLVYYLLYSQVTGSFIWLQQLVFVFWINFELLLTIDQQEEYWN